MARKKIKISRGALFARLLLAASILLLIPQKYTGQLNYFFLTVFGQVVRFTEGKSPEIFKPIFSEADFVSRYDYLNLEKEYNNALATIRQLRSEYEELSSIRKNIPNDKIGIVPAKVIPKAYSGTDELVINKGSLDLLRLNQYVLIREGNCVIGTISELYDSMARVKLFTASKHNMPVVIWRQGESNAMRGQLVGNGNGTAKIDLISKDKDILAGDVVFAAAKPGYLQAPIALGKIEEVKIDKDQPMLLDITVKPIDDLTKVQSVFVIVMDSKLKYEDRGIYPEND